MDISDGWRADWWNEAERLGVADEIRRLNALVDAAMKAKVPPPPPPDPARAKAAAESSRAFAAFFKAQYTEKQKAPPPPKKGESGAG